VQSIDAVDETSITATISLPRHALDGPGGDAPLLAAPVAVDAAGQLLGFWTREQLSSGYVVFPVRVGSIEFLGAPPAPDEHLEGRARVTAINDDRLVADIELVDGNGSARLAVKDWEDIRVHLSDRFVRFRSEPTTSSLSAPVPSLLPVLGDRDDLVLRWLDVASAVGDADARIWQDVLAHLVLSRDERASAPAGATERRRKHWLSGRIAAKDAVRHLVAAQHGHLVAPADVEILDDADGRPWVVGAILDVLGVHAPVLSLAHIDGAAVALAGDATSYASLGVDIERDDATSREAAAAVISDVERALLPDGDDGWLVRAWCAKEAASKASEPGGASAPRFEVVGADPTSGRISLGSPGADAIVDSWTDRTDDGTVVAATWRPHGR
jgi:4'-phosphopantetheinyl transferase EntD